MTVRSLIDGVTTCVVVWIEMLKCITPSRRRNVTTCVVVWIEIPHLLPIRPGMAVTTCVVVWIEIAVRHLYPGHVLSPPAWWCGLKSTILPCSRRRCLVTTCVVVWIEIYITQRCMGLSQVTTCVVVWIEI